MNRNGGAPEKMGSGEAVVGKRQFGKRKVATSEWKSRQAPANNRCFLTDCRNTVSSNRIVYQNLDGMFYAPKSAQCAQRKMAFPPHSTAKTLSEHLPRRLSGIILQATVTAESVRFRK
jgi:hypothetical protein